MDKIETSWDTVAEDFKKYTEIEYILKLDGKI